MRHVWFALVFLIYCTFSGPGASGSDFHSARTMGLGGAGHAAPLLNDALYLNPSFASFLPSYSFAVGYLGFSGDAFQSPNGELRGQHGRTYNVSLQDSRTEIFQAGLGYTMSENGAMIHAGASKSFLKRIGIGLGAKFGYSSNPARPFFSDGTLSVTGIAFPWAQASIIVDNLFQTDAAAAWGRQREFILGTKFNILGILMLYLDPHWIPSAPDGQTLGIESGAELFIFKDIYIRAGYFRTSRIPFQDTYGSGYGYGAGWTAPRISFDFGVTRVLESSHPDAVAWSASTTLYF